MSGFGLSGPDLKRYDDPTEMLVLQSQEQALSKSLGVGAIKKKCLGKVQRRGSYPESKSYERIRI